MSYVICKPVYDHLIGIQYNQEIAAAVIVIFLQLGQSLIKLACAFFCASSSG